MWAGEQAPPADFHPHQFTLKCFAFPGAETARKQFFSGGGKLPYEEIAANPAYTPPGSIKAREGLRFRGGGGASSPATATPTQFPLKSFGFPGAEPARKQFLLRGASSPPKKLREPGVHAAGFE